MNTYHFTIILQTAVSIFLLQWKHGLFPSLHLPLAYPWAPDNENQRSTSWLYKKLVSLFIKKCTKHALQYKDSISQTKSNNFSGLITKHSSHCSVKITNNFLVAADSGLLSTFDTYSTPFNCNYTVLHWFHPFLFCCFLNDVLCPRVFIQQNRWC